MRIGFDVSQTGRLKAGCGYFADSLIRHLADIDSDNEYILYPTFGDFYWDPDWPTTTCQISRHNVRPGLGHRTWAAAQLLWSCPASDLEAQLGNPDIIHANNFFCPVGLKKARLVYTLYDLGFVEHPDWTTERNRTGCFDGVYNASLYADLIIAISDYTRRHFLEIFPHYPADQIIVVYPASRFLGRTDFAGPDRLPQLQPERFWLSVGTMEPRKNHRRLLQAYASLKTRRGQTFPLVLVGPQGWLMDDFEKTIDDLRLRQDLILLGYVDDRALQWLYQNCFAFVYPSLFEGFGLPVLEAMSLGAPVIASENTSIGEIVDEAGILVDALCEEAIAQEMLRLSTDAQLRAQLKQKSVQQAMRFSWEATARSVLSCYKEVVAQPRLNNQ